MVRNLERATKLIPESSLKYIKTLESLKELAYKKLQTPYEEEKTRNDNINDMQANVESLQGKETAKGKELQKIKDDLISIKNQLETDQNKIISSRNEMKATNEQKERIQKEDYKHKMKEL